MTMRPRPVRFLLFVTCAVLTILPFSATSAEQPNIVFVFIDDLGYGDLSCQGNPDIKTPAIDRIAAEGTRFTQFYVASPICSPSRVGVTTGQYPARHRVHSYLASRARNRQRGMVDFLDPSAPCIARAFQQAGYATGHFGKWHIGGGRDVDDAPLPQAYGFDESLVDFQGLGDRVLPPGGLGKASEKLGQGKIVFAPLHKLTEIQIGRSIDFIRRHRQEPFYVHVWLNDVHDPFAPTPEQMGRFARFSDNRYVQQFYATLDEVDRQIGRLVDEIDALGLGENTLVVVTGDNGPTAWASYERQGLDAPGLTGGLRGRKWSLYEGGIREPLIARWTGRIPAGRVDSTTVLAAIDLFPTFCKLAGVKTPDVAFDGLDMSRALLGEPIERPGTLFWEYGRDGSYLRPALPIDRSPCLAVREGRWKLLSDADGGNVELYDLEASAVESKNLATEHPEQVESLGEKLQGWKKTLPAYPESSVER